MEKKEKKLTYASPIFKPSLLEAPPPYLLNKAKPMPIYGPEFANEKVNLQNGGELLSFLCRLFQVQRYGQFCHSMVKRLLIIGIFVLVPVLAFSKKVIPSAKIPLAISYKMDSLQHINDSLTAYVDGFRHGQEQQEKRRFRDELYFWLKFVVVLVLLVSALVKMFGNNDNHRKPPGSHMPPPPPGAGGFADEMTIASLFNLGSS